MEGCSLYRDSDKTLVARYHLSLLQQRFLLYIITLMRPKDRDFKLYEIDVMKCCEFIKLIEHVEYERFKFVASACMRFLNKKVELYESEQNIVNTYWFAQVNINENSQDSLTVVISPPAKEYLLQLKRILTDKAIDGLRNVSNIYVFRMYEILKAQFNTGKNVYYSDLDNLIWMFDAKDNCESDRLYTFHENKMLQSWAEMNQYTDFTFAYLTNEKIVENTNFTVQFCLVESFGGDAVEDLKRNQIRHQEASEQKEKELAAAKAE